MKILRKPLFYAPLLFILIGIPASFFYGKNYLENRLEKGVKYRDIEVRADNFHLSIGFKSINLKIDSLWVITLKGKGAFTGVKCDLKIFQSSFGDKPFLKMKIDSADIFVLPTDKEPETHQELQIPKIRVPRSIFIEWGTLRLVHLNKAHVVNQVRFESTTPTHFKLTYKNLQSDLIDFNISGQVEYVAKRGKPGKIIAHVNAGQDSTLWKVLFSDKTGEVYSMATDFKVDSLKKYLPEKHKKLAYIPDYLKGTVAFQWEPFFDFQGEIEGGFEALEVPGLPDFKLSHQTFNLLTNLKGRETTVMFTQKGLAGESVFLDLRGEHPWDSLGFKEIKPHLQSLQLQISGFAKQINWPLGGEILPLDFKIHQGSLTSRGFKGHITSKDGSEIKGTASWLPEFKANFSTEVSPEETWAIAWTDTNVYFEKGLVTGEFENGELKLRARTQKTRAYGARGDSLHAWLRINKSGLIMDSALVYWGGTPWDVTGEVNWLPEDQNLKWVVSHPKYGVATYFMPNFHSMSVSASQVNISKSPYRFISKLYQYKPLITGTYKWDFEDQFGMSDVLMDLNILGNPLSVNLESKWTPEEFQVSKFALHQANQLLDISGKLKMEGKPFYEIYTLGFKDILDLNLVAQRVNLAPWISLVKDSLITKLKIDGDVNFRPETGFGGSLQVTNIDVPLLEPWIKIKKGNIHFTEESIHLTSITESNELNLLNDSVSIYVSDILDSLPRFAAEVFLNHELKINYSGEFLGYSGLSGDLSATGKLKLPRKAGKVSDVALKGMLTVPLQAKADVPFLFVGRLSHAKYAYDAQWQPLTVSSDVRLDTLGFQFDRLQVNNTPQQTLLGSGSYQLPQTLDFNLAGTEFNYILPGDAKVKVQNLSARFLMSPDSLSINVKTDYGKYHNRDEVIDVAFDFKGWSTFQYPLGDDTRFKYPSLNGNIRLAKLNFNHDTFGFANLKKLVRPRSQTKQIKRNNFQMNLGLKLILDGNRNVIQTEFLKTTIDGNVDVTGLYPSMLLQGEITSLKGGFGISSQFYNINEMNIKWNEEKVSEGEVIVLGQKTLAEECNNPNADSCYLEVKLTGPLDRLEFAYDGTCGQELGQSVDPLVILSSMGKGCFDPLSSTGAAAFAWAEGKVNQFASSKIQRLSGKTIQNIKVQGTQNLMREKEDELGSGTSQVDDYSFSDEAISIEIETAEKAGFKLKAKSGYIPYAHTATSPWEHEGGVQWHPPADSTVTEESWKKKFNIESKVKSTPPQKELQDFQQDELRLQMGLNYNYDFWELW